MSWDLRKEQLIKDLKRFGLNPRDWIFQKGLSGKNHPQILVHRQDQNFAILGKPESSATLSRWQEITVLSI